MDITLMFYGSMIVNYLFVFLFIFLRSAIIKAIKLKVMTTFGHDFCVVRIYNNDKRIKKYVIKPDKDTGEFIVNNGLYIIDPKRANFEGSIPCYTYVEGCYNALDLSEIETSLMVDPKAVNKVVLRAKATGKLAEWFKQNKTIVMLIIVTGAIALIGAYFGYMNNTMLAPTGDATLESLLIKHCSGTSIIG